MSKIWRTLAAKGFYENEPLITIAHRDFLAVEVARRLLAFHSDKDYRNVALSEPCFLLISWGGSTKALEYGKIPHRNGWCRANQTIWANITPEYFDKAVEPLLRRFSVEEIQQGMFGGSYLQNYELVSVV